MDYKMEELLPVVKYLSERFTGKESTSVTYETARRLMEAVLYCLEEYEAACWNNGQEAGGNRKRYANEELKAAGRADARAAYDAGYRLVLEKTRETKRLYEEIADGFLDYGNRALHDTVLKGMPEFFIRYDPLFCPQDHLLTLDYPVLRPLEALSGTDRICAYLSCIRQEQRLLRKLPAGYVEETLRYYHRGYRELCFNLCGIVLRNMAAHAWIGVKIVRPDFTDSQWGGLRERIEGKCPKELEGELREQLRSLLEAILPGEEAADAYFSAAMRDLSFELANGVENHSLKEVFSSGYLQASKCCI